ncbi:MAG: ABC transporter ATP-binding protein [Patescibacteria group bacterium]
MSTETKYPRVGTLDVFKALWRGIKPQKGIFFLLIGASIVSSIVASVLIPLSYKEFFDILSGATNPSAAVSSLLTVVVTIALFNVFRWLARRIVDFSISNLEANSMARLRQQAFEYLVRHSHTFFSNTFTGSLVQRVSRLARSVERLLDTLSFTLIPLLVTVLGAIIVVWHQDHFLAFVIAGWIVAFFACNFAFSLWRVKYSVRVAEADSKTTGTLADIISNQSAVSLFSAFSAEEARFKSVTRAQAKITRFTWDVANIFDALQAALIGVAEFLIFWYAVPLWAEGAIGIGTLVLVQVYLFQLASQLWDFGRIIRTLYELFADSKEMVEIMTLPHEIKDAPDARELSVQNGEVEFRGVSFNFQAKNKILDNVSVRISAGQKVALVGPSGAGKTTFVRLLLRFHDLVEGRILIDGEPIEKVTLDSLHENIALVPQDPVLFHRTLMENIRYGRISATDEEVKEAARLSHSDEFIEALPLGYQTYVGERGVKLSGGERQRIAIARAILKNAPILVLDEATSSLDSHSEALIQGALETLMRGKTVIAIAHRLSTIRTMDRIIVLEGGSIREDGTHEALLKNPTSLYRELWNLQAGGFILEEEVEETLV